MALTLLSALIIPPTQAQARGAFHGLVMPPGWYKRVSQCEVGRNADGSYRWSYESKSYTSGFGIARGTWQRWSNSTSARGKTARYQAEVVDNIAWNGHHGPDGYVHPVGPWGWAVVRNDCMGLKKDVCRSRHPLVQRWKYRCR